MADPGWYADPTAPDGKRYWDGQAWVDTGPPKRRGLTWALVGLVVVVTGAIVIALIQPSVPGLPFLPSPTDTRTARPTDNQWNELAPTDTPSPTPVESGFGEIIDCPTSGENPRSEVRDGRLSSGHLSIDMTKDPDWQTAPSYVDWMYDYNSAIRSIAPGWISNAGVGHILVSDGFSDNLKTAAEQFISCMASSGMFTGFYKREVLLNEDYTVAGVIGWRLLSKVYVTGHERHNIQGDEVNIVLLPTDDADKIAVYVSCATIDHQDSLAEVQGMFETLTYQ